MSKFRANGVSRKNNTHSVSESKKSNNIYDSISEDITRTGYSVVKKVFSKKDCLLAKRKIDEIYRRQINECGNEDFLFSINDENVARSLFLYDNF